MIQNKMLGYLGYVVGILNVTISILSVIVAIHTFFAIALNGVGGAYLILISIKVTRKKSDVYVIPKKITRPKTDEEVISKGQFVVGGLAFISAIILAIVFAWLDVVRYVGFPIWLILLAFLSPILSLIAGTMASRAITDDQFRKK